MIDLHIRLKAEIIDRIELLGEGANTSEKIRNFLESELITKDKIIEQISFHKERIKSLEHRLRNNIFYDVTNLPEEEMKFLLGAIETIKKDSKYVYGQKNAYEVQFNKKMSISDFKVLLREIQDGNKQ